MIKIDSKVIAATALILGLFIGFYADSTILSKPQIQILTDTVNEQTNNITTLETQLSQLQGEHTTLQTLYDQLQTSAEQNSEEQINEIENLQTQINSLTNTIETRENTINDMQDQIDELIADYNDLHNSFDEIYNPIDISFTANNLMIELSTASDKYPENTAIIGTVSIKYSDGSSFLGTYKLSIYKLYINSGASSGVYNINGNSLYTWNNPFILGSGSYRLSISEIKDAMGNEAVSNSQLRNQVIYIFMG